MILLPKLVRSEYLLCEAIPVIISAFNTVKCYLDPSLANSCVFSLRNPYSPL